MTAPLTKSKTILTPQCITTGAGEYFFGYFDKCPWNKSQRYMLVQRAKFTDRMPRAQDELEIGLVEVEELDNEDEWLGRSLRRHSATANAGASRTWPQPPTANAGKMAEPQVLPFQKIATTRAWSWQQGAMLQWHPAEPENTIIYNDFRDGKFVSVVKKIDTELEDGGRDARPTKKTACLRSPLVEEAGQTPALPEKILPRAVAAVSPDGRWAGCLNFARLFDERPGYGYCNAPDLYKDELAPQADGLEIIDMQSGAVKQIISLAELAGEDGRASPALQNGQRKAIPAPHPSMQNSKHWINHLLFSPSGQRLIFLHRWRTPNGGHQTRAYIIGRDGADLRCINDDVMTSHFDWEDENHIIAWARRKGIGDRYFRFVDEDCAKDVKQVRMRMRMTGLGAVPPDACSTKARDTDDGRDARPTGAEIIGEKTLTPLGDGHCTISPNGQWMLSDTYPDEDGIQHLFMYHLKTEKFIPLGDFPARAMDAAPLRCDLHPRFSRDGKQVCIDSTWDGQRKIYVVDISAIVDSYPRAFSVTPAKAGV